MTNPKIAAGKTAPSRPKHALMSSDGTTFSVFQHP